MGFRPTRRTFLAFGDIVLASAIAGCPGDSSSPTTDEPADTTAKPAISSEPATTVAERTTYPGGTDRPTVKGVEVPGSTSGRLTADPPNTVSLVEFWKQYDVAWRIGIDATAKLTRKAGL